MEISTVECNLLQFSGLGVSNPFSLAPCLFDFSVHGTVTLVHSIVGAATFELDAHLESVSDARMYHQKCMDLLYTKDFDTMLPFF